LIEELISDSFFHDAYGKTMKETILFEQKSINIGNPQNISKIILESIESEKNLLKDNNKSNNKLTSIEEDKVNKHPIMQNILIILDLLYNKNPENFKSEKIIPLIIQEILNELKHPECTLNIKIFFLKIIINKPEVFQFYIHLFLPILMKFPVDKNNQCGKGFHYFHRDISTLLLSIPNEFLLEKIIFNKENVDLISNYINALIKLSGDSKNIIFRTNLKILSDLMEKFKNFTFLNKKTIIDMLAFDDNKANSHIWKITAIQILATALDNNIPINDEDLFWLHSNNNNLFLNTNENSMIIDSLSNSSKVFESNIFIKSLEKNEEILKLLFKLTENHRTPVQSATIELLAKILIRYQNNNNKKFNIIYDNLEKLAIEKNEKLALNLIFRTSMHFKSFVEKKRIFDRLIILMKNSSQINRNIILATINNFFDIILIRNKIFSITDKEFENEIKNIIFAKNNDPLSNETKDKLDLIHKEPNYRNKSTLITLNSKDKFYIDDIYYNLYEIYDVLFVDPSDELIISLCKILFNLILCKENNYFEGIFKFIEKINKEIPKKESFTRYNFYDFLIQIFLNMKFLYVNLIEKGNSYLQNILGLNLNLETSYEKIYKNLIQRILLYLIENLEREKDQTLKIFLISFLNKNEVLPNDPIERFIYLLEIFANENFEFLNLDNYNFIQIIVKLILIISAHSADFSLKIYEKALSECEFKELNLNSAGYYLNRSQPITPTLAIKNTLDEVYETLIKVNNNINQTRIGFLRATLEMGDVHTFAYNEVTQNLNTIITASQNTNNFDIELINKNSLSNKTILNTINNSSQIWSNTVAYSNINNDNSSCNNVNNLKSDKNPFINNMLKKYQENFLSQHSSLINLTQNYSSIESLEKQKSQSNFLIKNNNIHINTNESEYFYESSSLDNKPSSSLFPNKKLSSNILGEHTTEFQFKAPRAKARKGFGKFFQENEMSYTPVAHSGEAKIRFVSDYSLADRKKEKKEFKDVLVRRWLNQQNENKKNKIKYLRNYRIGDLPDIQITNQDIIDPLIILSDNNIEISAELFIEISKNIYEESLQSQKNLHIEKLIEQILEKKNIQNYFIVSCLHRLLNFMMQKNPNNFLVNLSLVKKTGLFTKNFDSAILLLEEYLANCQINEENGQLSFNKKIGAKNNNNSNFNFDEKTNFSSLNLSPQDININQSNTKAWILLLKFYNKLDFKDIQIGLIQNFAANNNLFILNKSDFLLRLSDLLTKPNSYVHKNNELAKLLKTTFRMYNRSDLNIIKNENQMTNNDSNIINGTIFPIDEKYDISLLIDEDLKESMEEYTMKYTSNLGEWESISNYLDENKEKLVLNSKNYLENPEKIETILKSWIYNYESYGNFSNLVFNLSTKDFFKEFCNTNFSYYMCIWNIIKNDYDEALLYFERSKNFFLKNWLNLGNQSGNLKHAIINKIQKLYEIAEFLKIMRGDNILLRKSISKNSNNSKFFNNNYNYKNDIFSFENFSSYNNQNLKNDNLMENIEHTLSKWLERWPNYLYDSAVDFNELTQTRKIFFDKFFDKSHQNFQRVINENPILDTYFPRQFINISTNLAKKGELDISELNTKKALKFRRDNSKANSFIIYPFIKIKFKILEIEARNIINNNQVKDINERFLKLIKVLEDQMKTIVLDDKSMNKLNNLKIKLYLNQALFIYDNIYPDNNSINLLIEKDSVNFLKEDFDVIYDKVNYIFLNEINPYENQLDKYIYSKGYLLSNEKKFMNINIKSSFNNNIFYNNEFGLEKHITEFDQNNKFNNFNFVNTYKDLLRPMVKFLDELIRKDQFCSLNTNFQFILKKSFVEYTLRGLILEESKFSSNIPKIFNFMSENITEISEIFSKYSNSIKTDYFLNWKSQLIAFVNSNISDLIKSIVLRILELYPQSLYFPFMVVDKYSNIFQISEVNKNNSLNKNISNTFNNNNRQSELYKFLKKFYSEFSALNAFVDSLDCLNNPELRLKYWIENIKEIIQNYVYEKHNTENNKNNLNNINFSDLKSKTYSKIRNIIEVIYEEIFERNRKCIKNKIGTYNLKFSEDNEKQIKSILNSSKILELLNLNCQEILKEFKKILEVIHKIISKYSMNQRETSIEKLSSFSDWLSQYECYEFSNEKKYIEISNFFSTFNKNNNMLKIKITNFDQHVLVLSSVRKPKRLTVFGNDEKSYLFLVKGDEDLRMDQRIMEIFKVCNSILFKDSNCSNKNIKMNTFSVMPITVRLGIIEWVENTTPLRNVVKFSMNKIYGFKDWDFL